MYAGLPQALLLSYYGGATRFEVLTSSAEEQRQQWRRNRRIAYRGSLKHLFSCMAKDSLASAGFELYQTLADSLLSRAPVELAGGMNVLSGHLNKRIKAVSGSELIRAGELEHERIVQSATPLEIFYRGKKSRSPYADKPFAYTRIWLPQKQMVITTTGWIVMPMGFEVAGDLANDRLSTLLPADWHDDYQV